MPADPSDDPTADFTWWDCLMVRLHVWWWGKWHRYCTACDVIHRPWSRRHRSCRCGLSQVATWSDKDRAAFRAVLEAARQQHRAPEEDTPDADNDRR